jgi:cupin fold WbuC family metalloprotein
MENRKKNTFTCPDNLINDSILNIRRRSHHNFHSSYKDDLQKILISLNFGSYIRPHRHLIDPKEELLISLSGDLAIVFFSNNGDVIDVQMLKPFNNTSQSFGIIIQPDQWHMAVSISPNSLILEIKLGPFQPDLAKEYAFWAPEENSFDSTIFLNDILTKINKYENSIF